MLIAFSNYFQICSALCWGLEVINGFELRICWSGTSMNQGTRAIQRRGDPWHRLKTWWKKWYLRQAFNSRHDLDKIGEISTSWGDGQHVELVMNLMFVWCNYDIKLADEGFALSNRWVFPEMSWVNKGPVVETGLWMEKERFYSCSCGWWELWENLNFWKLRFRWYCQQWI